MLLLSNRGAVCPRTVPRQGTSARRLTLAEAKKVGSKKGVSALAGLIKKKQEAKEQASNPGAALGPASPAQYADPEVRGLLFALATSYYKATKSYLIDEVELEQLADAFYHAGFVCCIHDRFQEGVTDPRFIYANKAALELWETTWDQFIGMPSRLSAVEDADTQQYRQYVLDLADQSPQGVVGDQEGWRVSKTGRAFKMRGVTVLNVRDFSGEKIGQAEIFSEYELANGTVIQSELPPSEDDVKAAEAAVEEQGALVRSLKEVKGLTNQDPEVQNAVAELKSRKEAVVALRKKIEEALKAAEAAFDDEE